MKVELTPSGPTGNNRPAPLRSDRGSMASSLGSQENRGDESMAPRPSGVARVGCFLSDRPREATRDGLFLSDRPRRATGFGFGCSVR